MLDWGAKLLEEYSKRASDAVKKFSPKTGELCEAANYILQGGGKRIRGSLVYAVAEHYGDYDKENIDRLAAAIEMIHAYSLIHDDLPCMDDDDFRRGKPSCHKVYGEAQALLAGDGLLTLAFETLLGGNSSVSMFNAACFVARRAGIEGMVGGQYDELSAGSYTKERLIEIDKGKTCALIEAAVTGSALCCGKADKENKLWSEFAFCYGMAFQIKDDLLDEKEVVEFDMSKPSFFGVCGREKSMKLMDEYTKRCKEALKVLGEGEDGVLFSLVEKNVNRRF